MSKMILTISLIVVAVILVIYLITMYNNLIKYRNWVDESWGQIDVNLQRRYELIPNLVNTVKGHTAYEQETLEKVIQARSQIMNGTPEQRIEADNALQETLKSIFAVSEAYPELKANESFKDLQEQLETTENRIAYARQLFNKTVAQYNIRRETFPTVIFASLFGFKKRELLEVPEEAREKVVVTF